MGKTAGKGVQRNAQAVHLVVKGSASCEGGRKRRGRLRKECLGLQLFSGSPSVEKKKMLKKLYQSITQSNL